MSREKPAFKAVPFPRARRMIVDAGRYACRQNTVYGLLEFDITDVRRRFREHKARTGESLSVTAYVTACLARAVESNPVVHAYRNRRNQLIMFEDVDISVVFETQTGDGTFPILHIVRAANRKSFRAIHEEIRVVQTRPSRAVSDFQTGFVYRFLGLPQLLRDVAYWFFRRNPRRWKQWGGTVGVTSLGAFGRNTGWWLPMTNYTLSICVGGIVERPGYVGDALVKREYLAITIFFDHDVFDGGPVARFTQQFRELCESGRLLDE